MSDFNAAGIHPKFFEYNRTIWSWAGDAYYVSVHATSSVDWTDDSSCTGYCDPANMGLWIYSSATIAQQAFAEVVNDAVQAQSTPPTGPMVAPTVEYVHGRCLLLGADQNSIYGQVVTGYCV